MVKALVGMPFAALVTAVLFLLMYGLVKAPEIVTAGTSVPPIEWPTVRTDTDPKPRSVIDAKPDLPDLPPALPRDVGQAPDGPVVVLGPRPTGTFTATPDFEPGTGGLMALSTIAPSFPPSCQARGTEGFATVQFDVTMKGQVVNARVIDSSHSCFERAALTAMRGWQYRPAMTTQPGYQARGKTQRFAFKLDG